MPAIFLKNNKHSNVGLTGIVLVIGANYASNQGVVEIGHDCEFGPVFDEIVVSEDGVGFGQLGSKDLCDPG